MPTPESAADSWRDARADLGDLVARYAAAVDDRDYAGATALFDREGVLRTPDPPSRLAASHEHHGSAAILRALQRLGGVAASMHALTGAVFRPGARPDRAFGRVSCQAHHVFEHADGYRDAVWHIRYADEYGWIDGGWRFTSRDVNVTFITTAAVLAPNARR
jgi:hypothetical protein